MGQLFQGDFDLGRHAVARLTHGRVGPGVVVEDLHYGAVAVAQLIEDLRPSALILVGAMRRGRTPGALERRPVRRARTPEELQRAVGHAVTGYVDIDLVVDVALAVGALPGRTVAIEVEPVLTEPSEVLSPEVAAMLDEVAELTVAETRRAEVLRLADRLRARRGMGARLAGPLGELVDALREVDGGAPWDAALSLRDRLRDPTAGDGREVGQDADGRALVWALDRLRAPVQEVTGRGGDMQRDTSQDEGAADEVTVHRTTEQGDELTGEHSVPQRKNRGGAPYAPPRQPSQDAPAD